MGRSTTTRTISLDPEIERKGLTLAKRRGFKHSFSGYITLLIGKDDEQLKREKDAVGNGKEAANA